MDTRPVGEAEDDAGGASLSIGVFARRVGLAPSALRFYDDCGVLRPARVDGGTGYRFYAPEQTARAVLVRRLREAGLPLVDATVVLDGPPEDARSVLEGHARRTRDTARAAGALIEEILRELPEVWTPDEEGGREGPVTVRLGGAELSSAVRQVLSAVATGAVREEFPVLGCVLVECEGSEVRLVATDRYRLVVRVLRASEATGGPDRVLVRADELREVGAWALRADEVEWWSDGGGRSACVRMVGIGAVSEEPRALSPYGEGEFPAYRTVLEGLSQVRHRVIVERAVLREFLVGAGGPVVLRTGPGGALHCAGPCGSAELRAVCTGPEPGVRIAFDVEVLLQALDAAVGPDVLLEIASAQEPVVVRSADQGSFTTLVMPVRDPGEPVRSTSESVRCASGESGGEDGGR
ncbi:MerR family transcriptional regulator [Streptomyces sp. NBC_00237]|uniref:DNA polymerase III subunit beta family protein n=1 Tax=Streptomyces sp. NBC_00237 TaxID=2975687 RepID=UPI00225BB505|nr:MerR family transcriptional regulator [Streptomyces sp. NBC_00237]MCX5200027.1 MerR family transcriptional regulator [Streptomyces sp. NBC_00237]